MQHKLIAFIGGGNMAQAIVLGLLKQGYPAEQIIVNDPNETKRAFFAELGVQTAQDNAVSAKRADAVLLAVKPQMMAEVCRCLAGVDFSDKLLISIAAGISTARLQALIPSAKSVVRVMPNTPALVSEGMAGLFAAKNTAQADCIFVQWAKPFGCKMKRKCTQSPQHPAAVRRISSKCWKRCNKRWSR